MQTRKSVKFLCNDWLDITEGDGTIMRNIRPATPDDFNDFDFVFQVMVVYRKLSSREGEVKFWMSWITLYYL